MAKILSLAEAQVIFVYNIARLILYAYQNGFTFSFGEAWRPDELQKIYFDTRRSKTLKNTHGNRLAIDFNIKYQGRLLFAPGISDDQYRIDVKIAEKLGEYWMKLHTQNRWGADWNKNFDEMDETFRDPYHFEMKIS